MKAEFVPGKRVRFNIPNGASAKIVKYELEGFYRVAVGTGALPGHVDSTSREVIAHEDDLVLEEE